MSFRITKPFLRWAGGKRRLLEYLEYCMPSNLNNNYTFFEPFLGAGSMFFHIRPLKAILSDNNRDLIECYKAIKKEPIFISNYLESMYDKIDKEYYYQMRKRYNNIDYSIEKAALFIFLNKTCFHGIWRVNKKGMFNVPYGNVKRLSLPMKNDIISISNALSNAELLHCDYKKALFKVREGDLIYFDPPYLPLNGTSYFTHYTKEGFNESNHIELANIARKLSDKGCFIMISNADLPKIRDLYKKDFNISEIDVTRMIRSDGKRYKVRELIITNY